MNRNPFHELAGRLRRLYRDRENGLVFGVCAGIADYFDLNTLVIRGVALAALLLAPVPVGLIYLVAALLLRDRPLTVRDRHREREFWRRGATMGDRL
ncbi:MAG: PspC domain-containing protein [Gammaproteobacteria bacterium]|jgi:phage shock protein C|nr:PspC domain-containing protein [Gammaproteobacteria bacterium]